MAFSKPNKINFLNKNFNHKKIFFFLKKIRILNFKNIITVNQEYDSELFGGNNLYYSFKANLAGFIYRKSLNQKDFEKISDYVYMTSDQYITLKYQIKFDIYDIDSLLIQGLRICDSYMNNILKSMSQKKHDCDRVEYRDHGLLCLSNAVTRYFFEYRLFRFSFEIRMT